MNQVLEHSSEIYNSLLGIAEANRRLGKLGGDAAVGELLAVIQGAGLQDVLGVRLLHKHNDLDSNEVMLEYTEIDDEGFALITSATDMSGGDIRISNSWRHTPLGYVPIEFSRPELLISDDFDFYEHVEFFENFAKALRELDAEDVLGPCLNYGRRVLAQSPAHDAAFLEKTDSDNRANVVRYVLRDDVAFMNSAKTKWYAQQLIDSEGKLIWTTACNCFCSVFPQGGHQGTKTHR